MLQAPIPGEKARLREALVTTTLIQMIATFVALALTPIAPHAAADFGIDAHYIGFQISLIYLAGVFGSGSSGTLLLRHGAVAIEVVALGLFSAGLLLLATAKLPLGIAASLLIGLGYGLQNPASSQILHKACPPEKRSLVFSVKQAGVPVGAVVASLVLPQLDAAIGWRTGLALAAVVPLLLAVHMLRAHAHEPHDYQRGPSLLSGVLHEQKLVWNSGALRVLSALGLLYSAAQLSLSAFVVLMLVENKGWSLVAAAAVGGALQACGAVGRVSWGWLADRRGSGFGILALIGAVSTAGLCALPWLDVLPVAAQIVLLCVLGFCLSGWNGVVMGELAGFSPPGQTGRVTGGALVYTFIGVMLGPSGYALIYEVAGRYDTTFAIISVATAFGALASGVAAWRLHRVR